MSFSVAWNLFLFHFLFIYSRSVYVYLLLTLLSFKTPPIPIFPAYHCRLSSSQPFLLYLFMNNLTYDDYTKQIMLQNILTTEQQHLIVCLPSYLLLGLVLGLVLGLLVAVKILSRAFKCDDKVCVSTISNLLFFVEINIIICVSKSVLPQLNMCPRAYVIE